MLELLSSVKKDVAYHFSGISLVERVQLVLAPHTRYFDFPFRIRRAKSTVQMTGAFSLAIFIFNLEALRGSECHVHDLTWHSTVRAAV